MKSKVIFFLVFLISWNLQGCGDEEPNGYSFELFRDTKYYALAKAVESENIEKIDELLTNKKLKVDYQETKFGNTLLMVAVAQNKKESVKALLRHGADPNLKDHSDESAFVTAIDLAEFHNCDLDVTKILLAHGANVNTTQKIDRMEDNGSHTYFHQTALGIAASDECLNLVKLLVESGADINTYLEYEGHGAITTALLLDHLEIAKYLITHPKAEIPDVAYIRARGYEDEKRLSISDLLNEKSYPKSSDNYLYKREILEYLESINKK